MTVAVTGKVYDGMVLAADSATTFTFGTANGDVHQVYNNADKIFHLHRKLPVAAMTWGLASVGPASVATLAKDLRRRLMHDVAGDRWVLDPDAYTV